MESAHRSLSGWRVSPDADVAPGCARPDLNGISSPHLSNIFKVPYPSAPRSVAAAITELLDGKDDSSTGWQKNF